ncbi:hypothetical protein [Burkholderia pseudomallei]|uniref:hypothetical protein n=1 Tax=Burkholderia pseudomallei TaxID=28450 RepID=UPI000536AC35|nr:hypothetical protein [Burkholderia pseudomallei]KGW92101.1 hypothetical protein Y048_4548 [Burkholderia pseudomallei MSHR456]
MSTSFSDIPKVVIDYVRNVFSVANDKVTRAVSTHPSMHEETLDHILIMELTAAPPAFFANERMAVSIESHWLGGRWMYGRWEIADIAFFVLLRQHGHLVSRKVALLQTKRLYSKEIAVAEIDDIEYRIGIGRLADRTDPIVPLTTQRAFSFDRASTYGATYAGHEQTERIDAYTKQRGIPVYYGLYNPLYLPFCKFYPLLDGAIHEGQNELGCRVIPAPHVHSALAAMAKGTAPSVGNLIATEPFDANDQTSVHGWRLERFVADEVLRCRQGRLFDGLQDENLNALLYQRSAPISAAVTITIDIGADG